MKLSGSVLLMVSTSLTMVFAVGSLRQLGNTSGYHCPARFELLLSQKQWTVHVLSYHLNRRCWPYHCFALLDTSVYSLFGPVIFF